MSSRLVIAGIAIQGLLATAPMQAQEAVDGFVARSFSAPPEIRMPYRLFVPDAKARERPLPLIVYLHGAGGAGLDNLKQISRMNVPGTRLWTSREMQARHPAFVVAPQMPGDEDWGAPRSDELTLYASLAVQLIDALKKEFAIDADRIYLMGQSRGGRGTWDLISKRPDLFAAAVPVCGNGNAKRVIAARDVPVWAFHGAKDDSVPVAGSREPVAALRAIGSPVRYTEYPDAGHDIATLAFSEKALPEWLFAQKRAHRTQSPSTASKRH